MSNPMKQVGGDHYEKLSYQPVALALKLRLNAIQFSIIKYISRYKDKGGVEDINKALHFVEMGQSYLPENYTKPADWMKEVAAYCKANGFNLHLESIIRYVVCEDWMFLSSEIYALRLREYGV